LLHACSCAPILSARSRIPVSPRCPSRPSEVVVGRSRGRYREPAWRSRLPLSALDLRSSILRFPKSTITRLRHLFSGLFKALEPFRPLQPQKRLLASNRGFPGCPVPNKPRQPRQLPGVYRTVPPRAKSNPPASTACAASKPDDGSTRQTRAYHRALKELQVARAHGMRSPEAAPAPPHPRNPNNPKPLLRNWLRSVKTRKPHPPPQFQSRPSGRESRPSVRKSPRIVHPRSPRPGNQVIR
jgi:hypothetical protein